MKCNDCTNYSSPVPAKATKHSSLQLGTCPHCKSKLKRAGGGLTLQDTLRPVREWYCSNCEQVSRSIELWCDDPDFLRNAAPHVEDLKQSKRI